MQIYWKVIRSQLKGEPEVTDKYTDPDSARADYIYFKERLGYKNVKLITVREKDNGEIREEIWQD